MSLSSSSSSTSKIRSSLSSNSIITNNNSNTTKAATKPTKLSLSSTSSSTAAAATAAAATQACAACKYQRRRCTPDCPLAPYFPADQQRQFLNAHRLFGVSNILKIVRGLDPRARDEAMASIVFQSDARAADPVGGCYRIVLDLQRQIDHCHMELSLVFRQLALYRAAALTQTEPAPPPPPPDLIVTSGDQQQFFDYFCYDSNDQQNGNVVNGETIGFDVNVVVGEDGVENGGNGLEMEMLSFQQKGEGEEDVKPLVDMFDVLGGEEDEEVSKAAAAASAVDGDGFFFCCTKTAEQKDEPNSMEHVQEHDLKEAASLFTLTNCNTSTV